MPGKPGSISKTHTNFEVKGYNKYKHQNKNFQQQRYTSASLLLWNVVSKQNNGTEAGKLPDEVLARTSTR